MPPRKVGDSTNTKTNELLAANKAAARTVLASLLDTHGFSNGGAADINVTVVRKVIKL